MSDADPLADGWPVVAIQPFEEAADFAAAERTARVLNEWMLLAHERLAGRDLDFMLLKWPGARPELPSFAEKFGLRGASLGAGPLYAGLASALGMAHVEIPADLRDPRRDLEVRLDRAFGLARRGGLHPRAHQGAGPRLAQEGSAAEGDLRLRRSTPR